MLDYVIAFGHVIGFSIAKATKAVLLNLTGPGGSPDLANLEKDDEGETATGQESYGALGRIVAPRRPTKLGGNEMRTEHISVRRADGMVPIALRDLRLNAFYPNPKEGTIADVGYAGAFDANEPTFDGDKPKSSVRTIYVPYAFDGSGVPTKAHAITVDATSGNVSISIIHGEGMAITMMAGGKNSVVIKNKAGNAYVEVNDDGITANGNTVVNGGAVLGTPLGAQPAAVATPLVTYLTALEVLLGTISAATVPTTAAAVTAFVSAQAANKGLIPATLVRIK
jgi:hypothetical protein